MANDFAMSVDERQRFLADVHVGVISIAEPDRGPLAVPVWYSYEPGGDISVLMQGDSRKMKSINAAGRFSLCAQTESSPYQYVSVEGPVSNVRPNTVDELQTMASRYLGDEGGRQYAESSGTGDNGVMVTMTPQRWWTTDYSKR